MERYSDAPGLLVFIKSRHAEWLSRRAAGKPYADAIARATFRDAHQWLTQNSVVGAPAYPDRVEHTDDYNRVWRDLIDFLSTNSQQSQATQTPGAVENGSLANNNGDHRIAATATKTFELVLEEDGAKVLAAARSKKAVNDKMIEIVDINPHKYVPWKSPQWADLLDVSASAIRDTDFWRVGLKEMKRKFLYG